MKWEYLREEEFEGAIERSGGLCVLPMGCLEKHGQHLPVGCDSLKAIGVVEEAAALEDVMVFPTGLWLGDVCQFHADADPGAVRKRGGIGLNPNTILTVLEELCDEIARNGFRKILIVNSHGGNRSLCNQFARNLMYKPRNYAFMSMYVGTLPISHPRDMYPVLLRRRAEFPYLTDEDMAAMQKFAEMGNIGGHGHWTETAQVYSYYPETVAMDRCDAEDGSSMGKSAYLSKMGLYFAPGWHNDHPNYYDAVPPFGCNERIGKATTRILAEQLAGIFKTLKEDEECVRMAKAMHTPELLFD